MLRCAICSVALVASAAKASRQKTRKSAFGRFFFVCTSGVFAPRRSSGLTRGPQARPAGAIAESRQTDPRTRLPTCGKIKPRKPAIRQFLPSREGFNYNTGHFGAGNTVARRVIKPASPRNCRQETYS
jgi:hypothetical protein